MIFPLQNRYFSIPSSKPTMLLQNSLPLIIFLLPKHCHRVNFAHSLMSKFTPYVIKLKYSLTQDLPLCFSFTLSNIGLHIHLTLTFSYRRHSEVMVALKNTYTITNLHPLYPVYTVRNIKTSSTSYMAVLASIISGISSTYPLKPQFFHTLF